MIGLIEGIECIHGAHWGDNTRRRGSQGGLTLKFDSHEMAHRFQDDDDRTQNYIDRPGLPSMPLATSTTQCRAGNGLECGLPENTSGAATTTMACAPQAVLWRFHSFLDA